MSVSRDPWVDTSRDPWVDTSRDPRVDADMLQRRLRALTAGQAEIRAILGELAVCPYRSGLLGAGAPVLPSPDELQYVSNILDRVANCLRHAIVLSRHDEMAEG